MLFSFRGSAYTLRSAGLFAFAASACALFSTFLPRALACSLLLIPNLGDHSLQAFVWLGCLVAYWDKLGDYEIVQRNIDLLKIAAVS